jgi:hypothetical protein
MAKELGPTGPNKSIVMPTPNLTPVCAIKKTPGTFSVLPFVFYTEKITSPQPLLDRIPDFPHTAPSVWPAYSML